MTGAVERNGLEGVVVAVGTTRDPKVRAVRHVLDELVGRFPDFLAGGPIRLEAREVPSGVPSTPRNFGESMEGARKRAQRAYQGLRSEGLEPRLGIGLEGGLTCQSDVTFLEAWAYVTDGARGHFGSSGSIPLPDELARDVMSGGEDLGAAADRYFQTREIAAREGTFGVLTGMMVSREEAFRRALLHALAPFYNAGAYRDRGRLR
jgi:inosine/xanthosine triphosphatase